MPVDILHLGLSSLPTVQTDLPPELYGRSILLAFNLVCKRVDALKGADVLKSPFASN